MRPDVSLSSRCTIPGRLTPPIPESDAPQWWISALTSVPVAWPGAGMGDQTRRFVDDDQVHSSSKTTSSGMSSPQHLRILRRRRVTSVTCAPTANLAREGSRHTSPPTLTCSLPRSAPSGACAKSPRAPGRRETGRGDSAAEDSKLLDQEASHRCIGLRRGERLPLEAASLPLETGQVDRKSLASFRGAKRSFGEAIQCRRAIAASSLSRSAGTDRRHSAPASPSRRLPEESFQVKVLFVSDSLGCPIEQRGIHNFSMSMIETLARSGRQRDAAGRAPAGSLARRADAVARSSISARPANRWRWRRCCGSSATSAMARRGFIAGRSAASRRVVAAETGGLGLCRLRALVGGRQR